MVDAKYPPEEIERLIDEEISRIEAANQTAATVPAASASTRSYMRRFLDKIIRSKTPQPTE